MKGSLPVVPSSGTSRPLSAPPADPPAPWAPGRALNIAAAVFVVLYTIVVVRTGGLDMWVYRHGGRTLWERPEALYGAVPGLPGGPALPFTYPPFAAMIFMPMAALPGWAAYAITSALTVLATFFCARDLAPRLVRRWPVLAPWTSPFTLTAVWIFLGPVRDSLWYGQINSLLMAVCYLAYMRYRSVVPFAVVVGICAGIKLTPAAYLLIPLVLLQWRGVSAGIGSFLATQLLTLMIWPALTTEYWTSVILDPSRVGGLTYPDNVSVRSVTERLDLPSAVWAGLVLLIIVTLGVLISRAAVLEDRVVLLGLGVTCSLLISPVTWAHHWVWLPVVLYSWICLFPWPGAARTSAWVLMAAATCVFVITARFLMIELELDHKGPSAPFLGVFASVPPVATLALTGLALATFRPRRGGKAPSART